MRSLAAADLGYLSGSTQRTEWQNALAEAREAISSPPLLLKDGNTAKLGGRREGQEGRGSRGERRRRQESPQSMNDRGRARQNGGSGREWSRSPVPQGIPMHTSIHLHIHVYYLNIHIIIELCIYI